MWDTEAKFSHAIMNKLKSIGFDCMRIETGSTTTGCPDLWIQGHGDDFFIEFKNIKTASIHDKEVKIPWRPGQQAWATRYRMFHAGKKCSYTFAGLSDGWIAIKMNNVFNNNIVQMNDENVFINPDNIIKILF